MKHGETNGKWNGGRYIMWMKKKRKCTWTKLWSLIEGGGDGLKMKKWEKLQGGVGKACFSISHDHAKFSHSHAK